MTRFVSLLLVLVPSLAFAGGVQSTRISSKRLTVSSPGRYALYFPSPITVSATGFPGNMVVWVPGGAKLVDVIVYQRAAGTVGTSWSLDIQNSAGTSLLSALATATQASGANQVTDAKGDIALPSGWTRPVIKTDGTATLAKGAWIGLATTESGSYSTHASATVALVFEPVQ